MYWTNIQKYNNKNQKSNPSNKQVEIYGKLISESNIIAYLVGAIQELDTELKRLESLKGIRYH